MIHSYIIEMNDELLMLWEAFGNTSNSRNISKPQLQKKYSKLKKEYDAVLNKKDANILEALLKLQLNETKENMSRQLGEIEVELKNMSYKCYELESLLRRKSEENTRLAGKVFKLEQEKRKLYKELVTLRTDITNG
jgi:hypothetical protein